MAETFVTFAFLSSYIAVPILARRSGRNWLLWLLIAIAIGPLAYLLLFLRKKKDAERIVTPYEERTSTYERQEVDPWAKIDTPYEERTSTYMQETQKQDLNQPYKNLSGNISTQNLSDKNTKAGYVYVVTNPSIDQSLVKIGFTKKDPSERLDELDQAGLPSEYIEHYRIYTQDALALEQRLHKHFASVRFREDKEFFKVPPVEVYQVLQKWGVNPLEL